MNGKRITGIIAFLIGIALLIVAIVIKGRVAEGREQIDSAQRKVDTGSAVVSVNPITDIIGRPIKHEAQRQINEGRSEADYYANLSDWSLTLAIIFMAGGVLLVCFPWKKKR